MTHSITVRTIIGGILLFALVAFVGGFALNIASAQDATTTSTVGAVSDPTPVVSATSTDTSASTSTVVTSDTSASTTAPDPTTITSSTTTTVASSTASSTVTDTTVTDSSSTPTTEASSTSNTPVPASADTTTTPTASTPAPTPAPTPTLSTDQSDYHPSAVVSIFGSMFAALQNVFLHLTGGSAADGNVVDQTVPVTADAKGSFTYGWNLSDLFVPFYNLVALDINGNKLAETNFTDSLPTDFAQCSNNNSPVPAGGCNWIGSIIQQNNSTYFEGMTVPQRLLFRGFVGSASHTITFQYQYTKGGIHAYDFLTYVDPAISDPSIAQGNGAFTPGTTVFNKCDNLSTSGGAGSDTNACNSLTGTTGVHIPVPADTYTSKNGSQSARETAYQSANGSRYVTMFARNGVVSGSSIVTSPAVTIGHDVASGADTGDSFATTTITFTVPTNTCTNNNKCDFILYFGGHLARTGNGSGDSWGPGLGSSQINGGPYHIKSVQFDGVGGSQDNQIKGSDILVPPGSITIIKQTNPATSQSFSFSATAVTPTSVSLMNGGSQTWTNIASGTSATITETPVVTWSLGSPIVCAGNTQSSVTQVSNGITIVLRNGENVTCTFVNTKTQSPAPVTTAIHDASHTVVTSVPAGTTVHDSVNVGGSNPTPTGTINVDFFTNGTCTGPADSNSGAVTISGNTTDVTGFAKGPLAAGSYSFLAHYSGDPNYTAGNGPCEPLTVTKVTPFISTTPSAGGTIGVTLNDTANVTGGFTPTGSVTFKLFPPSDAACAGTASYTNTAGTAPYATSPGFVSNAAGVWHWTADYAGDANNNPASSGCSAESVTVAKVSPSISTTLSSLAPVALGASVHDSSTLSGATVNAGGTVTYTVYTDTSCSQNAQSAGTKTVTNGTVPDSDPITFNNAGDFYWQAVYSGDANNSAATSVCMSEHLVVNKATPTVSTDIHNAAHTVVTSVDAGTTVHDSATLSGGSNPTGTVAFTFYTNASCQGSGTAAGTVALSGAVAHPSSDEGPLNAGSYSFKAHYNGDGNNNGADGACEPLTVNKVTPSISTTPSAGGVVGVTLNDTANVTGGFTPTGSVTFKLFPPSDAACAGTASYAQTVALTAGSAATSPGFASNAAGTWGWSADYSGDASNNPASSGCQAEQVTVTKASPTLSTTIHDAAHNPVTSVALGSIVHDSAAISGGFSPAGNVDFTFYTGASCQGNGVSAGSVLLSGGIAHPSDPQGPLAAGSYSFKAHYVGDANNDPADAQCEPLTVNKADTTTSTQVHNTNHQDVTNGTLALGSIVHDSATVGTQVDSLPITGTVTYHFYTQTQCGGQPTDETVAVGSESSPTSALAVGSYGYVAEYSGDGNYKSSKGICEPFSVQKGDTSLVTEIHDAQEAIITSSVPLGTTVHDKATLSGKVDGIVPTGMVDFTFYTAGNNCQGDSVGAGSIAIDSSGIAHPSSGEGPLNAGSYSFSAHYKGDGNYNASDAACEPLTVEKADTSLTTDIHNESGDSPVTAPLPLGSSVHDKATLSGQIGTIAPTGTVNFTWYTNGTCDGTGAGAGSVALVSNVAHPSSTEGPLGAGSYSFKASYPGDSNYHASMAQCEPLTVDKGQLSIATTIHDANHNPITSGPLGSIVHDTAHVSGQVGSIVPTGTVTFTFGPQCGSGVIATDGSLDNGDPRSVGTSALAAGSYNFQASVADDPNYKGATSACEPLTINKAQLGITTTVHDASHAVVASNAHVPLASVMHDNATVTGAVANFPIPAISFTFDGGAISNDAAEGSFNATSVATAALGAGNHKFNATVASNDNYTGAASDDEPFVVDKAQLTLGTTIHKADHTTAPSNVSLGTTLHDTAQLGGTASGFTAPTPTFTLTSGYSNDCSAGTSVANGAGEQNGDANSVPSSPLAAGTYAYRAAVAGNANYLGTTSSCEPVTVDKAQLSITTTVHDAPDAVIANGAHVPLGTATHDNATVTGGVGGFPVPSISFMLNASPIANGSTEAGFDATSVSSGALGAGSFTYKAAVASDGNYVGATSDPEPFTVDKGQLSIATTIHDNQHAAITSSTLGSVVHDTAHVTGQVDSIVPTGAVTFTFDKSPSQCGATAIGTAGSPDLSTGDPRSNDTSTLTAGSYNFQASVAGDANYEGATSVCEPLAVAKASTGLSTEIHNSQEGVVTSIATGGSVHDKATLTGKVDAIVPTGNADFTFFNNASCTPTGTSAGSVAFDGSGVAHPSTSEGPLTAGQYSFQAAYAGDDNYSGSTAACEPLSVVDGTLSISPATAYNKIGDAHTITATVTKNDGTGSAPASGVLVTFSVTSGSAALVGGVNTCTTDGSGECSVHINSTSSGANTVHATATYSVNGISITRATGDGLSGDTADAHKTYEDAQITITGDSTNEVGHDHAFTVTVKKDVGDGAGLVVASGAAVSSNISGTGSISGGTCSATTDSSGQCTIIVHSTTAGTGTVHASVTLTLNGVSITRATGDGLSGDSTDTHKTWVDANISLTPLDATNNIGSPHTVTVTVNKNPGSGSVVAAGEHVDFTLTPAGGATPVVDTAASTCDDAGPNTNGSGQCTIIFNSATPGTVAIHATVTLTVGGVSLTRSSGDSRTGDSADANKTYVAGSLQVTKALVLGGYSLPVNGTFKVSVDGPSYPAPSASTTLTFTVLNGVVSGAQTLTPLIPGTYHVIELNSGVAWTATVTGGGSVTVVAGQTAPATVTNTLKLPHTSISIVPNTQETVAGENVILTISDKNDGAVPLTNDSVVLTYGATTITLDKNSPNFSGDTNGNGVMDPGETWSWTVSVLISANTTFTVVGHGTDPLGNDITPTNGYASETSSTTVMVVTTTRTLGFWQTHTSFTSAVFSTILGGSLPIGIAPHKGVLITAAQIFGGFYAPIPKTTAGAKRTPVDQARITLLQQLLAAKLNCAAFGCSSATATLIAKADADYAAGDKNAILADSGALDAYNNSLDTGAIPAGLPPTGKATPSASKASADLAFWNNP